MPQTVHRVVLTLLLCLATSAFAKHPKDRDGDGFPENDRYMPAGDPNLDPNWDWTVSGAGHTLYYTDASGIIRNTVRQLPFFTSGHALNTLEKDMYPEDGWMLAYRDFGTPTAAPDLPFFVLYNRYRGIFRVMIFNTREVQYSQFRLELSFKSTAAAGALFTYSDPVRAFTSDYDVAKQESFLVETNAFNGWIFGDFMLTGYDPNLHPDAQLRLNLRGINVSAVQLNSSTFTLSEVLTEANPGSSVPSTLQNLVTSVNAGHKTYSTVAKALKSLDDKAKNSTAWWAGTVRTMVQAAQFVPYVGGVIGFVRSFFGGASKPAPREPLNFQGALEMTGDIVQSTPLYSLDFGLKTPATGGNPPDYYRPVREIPWGIFNLVTKPGVDITKFQECPGPSKSDCYIYFEVMTSSMPGYVFNANAGLQLVSVEYALTHPDRGPTSFSQYPPDETVNSGTSLPDGFAVKVTLRPATPTRYSDTTLVFYKVYPFTKH